MSPLADHLLHFPPPQVEAKDLTERLKRIRDTTCLFRAYAAYFTRNQQAHKHWVDGASCHSMKKVLCFSPRVSTRHYGTLKKSLSLPRGTL